MKILYIVLLFSLTTFNATAQFGAFLEGGLEVSDDSKLSKDITFGVSYRATEKVKLNLGVTVINDIQLRSISYNSGQTFSMQDPEQVKYQIVERGRYNTKSIYFSPQIFFSKKLSIESQFHIVQTSFSSDFNAVLFSFGTIEETVLQSLTSKKTSESKLFFRSALKMAYTFPVSPKLGISVYSKFTYDFNPDTLDTKTIDDYDFEFRRDPVVMDLEAQTDIKYEQQFIIFIGVGLEYIF